MKKIICGLVCSCLLATLCACNADMPTVEAPTTMSIATTTTESEVPVTESDLDGQWKGLDGNMTFQFSFNTDGTGSFNIVEESDVEQPMNWGCSFEYELNDGVIYFTNDFGFGSQAVVQVSGDNMTLHLGKDTLYLARV